MGDFMSNPPIECVHIRAARIFVREFAAPLSAAATVAAMPKSEGDTDRRNKWEIHLRRTGCDVANFSALWHIQPMDMVAVLWSYMRCTLNKCH